MLLLAREFSLDMYVNILTIHDTFIVCLVKSFEFFDLFIHEFKFNSLICAILAMKLCTIRF